jgi:hypothetical protein
MAEMLIIAALIVAGIFTLVLGLVHFAFPVLLDFRAAIPRQGSPIKPFRLWRLRYATQRSDVYGIAWVMNHASSYVLVTIGVLDLIAVRWLHTGAGWLLALWIAGWWLLRAGSQIYLGQRRGDRRVLAGFASLAVLHVVAALS